MENEKSKPYVLSYVIIGLLSICIILLLINLGATGFLIFRSQRTATATETPEIEPLPAGLSSVEKRKELFERFKKPFNNNDNENIHALLGPLAQVGISKEEINERILFVYEFTGNIESGSYSHYDYAGISEGKKWFVLYYELKTDKGPATLSVTIAQEGDEPYAIFGFYVDRQEQ